MPRQPRGSLPPGTPEELGGPSAGPLRFHGRLATLDVLRGFALLGILLLNIEDFSGPEILWDIPVGAAKAPFVGWHAHLDQAIVALKWLLAEGKMRGLFAMLFGAGTILLTERIERRATVGRAAAIFYRRNLWLGVFGLVHAFVLWPGDFLIDYAVLGLIFLYPLRRLCAHSLLVLGLSVWLAGGTFGIIRAFHMELAWPSGMQTETVGMAPADTGLSPSGSAAAGTAWKAADAKETAARVAAGRLGFFAGWPNRVQSALSYLQFKLQSGWILEWLGAMITGMGLYKSGFLTNRRRVWEYVVVALGGYLVVATIVPLGLWRTWQAGLTHEAQDRWMLMPYPLQVAAGTLANAAVILLLVRSGRLQPLTFLLAAVGRTAFSDYILTTILCQSVFAWSALKLYGRLEYYQTFYVVASVWAINLAGSALWLRVFAFGPLEWLWRSLTYWQVQPMLKQAANGP